MPSVEKLKTKGWKVLNHIIFILNVWSYITISCSWCRNR